MTFTISQTPDDANLYLYPNGSDSTMFIPFTEDENYKCVDDTWHSPNDDTDYVGLGWSTADEYAIFYETLRPNAGGWRTQYDYHLDNGQSGSGEATINYTCVNESTLSLGDYVYCTGGTVEDFYKYDNSTGSASGASISYIIPSYYINAAAPFSFKNQIYDGSNRYHMYNSASEAAGTYLISTATYINPKTRNEWTWTELDDYEFGVEMGSGQGFIVYQAYVDVYKFRQDQGSTVTDMYTVPDHTTETGTINYVRLYSSARSVSQTQSSSGTYKMIVEDSSASSYGANKAPLTTTYTKYYDTFTTKPSGGAWTWSEIDNMKIGMEAGSPLISNTYPEIRVSQLHAVVNYSPSASTVTLNNPETLSVSHSRKISRHTFPSGDYEVDDYGRGSKTLRINGVETSNAETKMQDLKDICHYGAKVTLADLPDTNLNTDYHVKDFSFSQDAGTVGVYRWSLTLEED